MIDKANCEEQFLCCKKLIDEFNRIERPKDKKIIEGLMSYYLEKMFKIE